MTPEALEALARALAEAREKETFLAYRHGEKAATYMRGYVAGMEAALGICRQQPLT